MEREELYNAKAKELYDKWTDEWLPEDSLKLILIPEDKSFEEWVSDIPVCEQMVDMYEEGIQQAFAECCMPNYAGMECVARTFAIMDVLKEVDLLDEFKELLGKAESEL